MATIKLSSTKVASRLINYCANRATEQDAWNCRPNPDKAKAQFRMTREFWDKTDGVQAHHVIQSFSPKDNITKEKANEIGLELAKKIAPNHEVLIYTHTDKAHIHNHIIINAVGCEDGKKYHSTREQLFKIREVSNQLCKEHGLHIIREPYAKERFSMAEYKAVERGESLWKDELRTAIDRAKEHTANLEDLKTYLKKHYDIEMKIQNKNVSFLHPEKQRFVRGDKLGEIYTKGALEHEYHGKQAESRIAGEGSHPRTTDRTRLDNILFGNLEDKRSVKLTTELSDNDRRQASQNEREVIAKHQEQSNNRKESNRDYREDQSSINRSDQRNERDQNQNYELSQRSNQRVGESDERRQESRNNASERVLQSSQGQKTIPERTDIPDSNPSRNESHGKHNIQSDRLPASTQTSVSALDALSKIGKAIETQLKKEEFERQQKQKKMLERMQKQASRERNYDRER